MVAKNQVDNGRPSAEAMPVIAMMRDCEDVLHIDTIGLNIIGRHATDTEKKAFYKK